MFKVQRSFILLCKRFCIQFDRISWKKENKFTGLFSNSSQVQSVPKTVLALTSALIDGEIISSNQPSQKALSVAQIIVSQMKRPSKRKARLKKPTWNQRYNLKQETPLLQYTGIKIFYTSRSQQLIEDLPCWIKCVVWSGSRVNQNVLERIAEIVYWT